MVANGDRPQGQGKCNREQTADGPPKPRLAGANAGSGKGETVR